MLSAIQHTPDLHHIPSDSIVNRVRKSFRQQSVIAPMGRVNAAAQGKAIDVRERRVHKVLTKTLALLLVKVSASVQVAHRGGHNPDLHSDCFRSCFFADSHSTNCSLPDCTRCSVAASSS